jgi:hypothetical protein
MCVFFEVSSDLGLAFIQNATSFIKVKTRNFYIAKLKDVYDIKVPALPFIILI